MLKGENEIVILVNAPLSPLTGIFTKQNRFKKMASHLLRKLCVILMLYIKLQTFNNNNNIHLLYYLIIYKRSIVSVLVRSYSAAQNIRYISCI